MIAFDCIYECGDEDCNKCMMHGYIFGCDGCDDYTTHRSKEEAEDDKT